MLCGWLYPDKEIRKLKKRNADRSKLEDYCRKIFPGKNITEYHPLSERSGNESYLYTGISKKKVKNEQDKAEDYVAFGWFKGDSLKKVAVILSAQLNKILSGELKEDGFVVSETNDGQRYLIRIYDTWQKDMWEDVSNA